MYTYFPFFQDIFLINLFHLHVIILFDFNIQNLLITVLYVFIDCYHAWSWKKSLDPMSATRSVAKWIKNFTIICTKKYLVKTSWKYSKYWSVSYYRYVTSRYCHELSSKIGCKCLVWCSNSFYQLFDSQVWTIFEGKGDKNYSYHY